jgi:hypothetical protein
MICERCHGTGQVIFQGYLGNFFVVCEMCGGCGVTHCCEGDCAQPEPRKPSLSTERGARPGSVSKRDGCSPDPAEKNISTEGNSK